MKDHLYIKPELSPEFETKLRLLAYPTPEGLHSIEASWREFARRLVQHIHQGEWNLIDLSPSEIRLLASVSKLWLKTCQPSWLEKAVSNSSQLTLPFPTPNTRDYAES